MRINSEQAQDNLHAFSIDVQIALVKLEESLALQGYHVEILGALHPLEILVRVSNEPNVNSIKSDS